MKKVGGSGRTQKYLLLISLILFFMLIGIIVLFKFSRNSTHDDTLVYQKVEAIGGFLDNDTYYIFGAAKDIAFKVKKEENFSYKIVDDGDNVVSTIEKEDQGIITITADQSYEDGKMYYLTIENGSFTDESYKDAKKIVFSIVRLAKQNAIFKDNLINANLSDIEVDKNILKSKNNYQANDIILGNDNGELKYVYKITKKNDTNSYEYIVPELKDVFEDIDYYGKEKINLAKYQNDKDFSLVLVETILNSLADTVYAKEDITVSKPVWNKKNNSLDIEIVIDTNNKKEFLSNHNSKIELMLSISIDLYYNVTIDHYDYIMAINYDTKVNNNLSYADNNFVSFYETIQGKDEINNYDVKWLEDGYNKLVIDKLTLDRDLGDIVVNTSVPGLKLLFNPGISLDINSKTILNTLGESNNTFIIGISDKLGVLGSINTAGSSDFKFIGDIDNKIGQTVKTKLYFLNMFDFNVDIKSSFYTNGESTLLADKEEDKTIRMTLNIAGDSGIDSTIVVEVNDISKKYDDKKELNAYKQKVTILSKTEDKKVEDKTEETEKKEYKYSKEEVKELLQQGYEALANREEWQTSMGSLLVEFSINKTINVNNNEFIGTWSYNSGEAGYTCTYNYVDEVMSCNNFDTTLNYIKNKCDVLYNAYLQYQETFESDIEGASEWEEMYGDLDTCYYETIDRTEPSNFKKDIEKILNEVSLTYDDLEVLKDNP